MSDAKPLWRRLVASRGLQMMALVMGLGALAWLWIGQQGGLEAAREKLGWWVALFTVPLQALIAVTPFPDEVIGLGNSALYGFGVGAVLNWTGWMMGAFLEYSIAARSARDFDISADRIAAHFPRLHDRFAPDHPAFLILARFVPIGGGHIVNASSGVYGVSRWRFFWTGAIGMVPGSIVIASVATGLVRWAG